MAEILVCRFTLKPIPTRPSRLPPDLARIIAGYYMDGTIPEGNVCKVMTNDAQYTSAMRNATSEIGSSSNPKIGVPVTYTRPKFLPLHGVELLHL